MSSLPDPTGERRAALPPARREGGPPPSPQPQRVTVDEMLSTLRNKEGGKRRRRSEQRVHKQRKKRRLWIIILGVVALLVAGGLWAWRFFQRYRLEGATFREGVNRRISSVLGCDVEFTSIHDGGAGSLAAKEAEIATRGTDLIESARLMDVSASLTSRSWMSNEWGITILSIGSGTIKLNPKRPSSAGSEPEIPAAPEGGDESRMTISPEPRLITIDAMRVTGGLNIEWPDAAGGKSPESIQKLVGGPKVRAGGVMEGSFINGVMNLRGLAPMTLNQISWKLTGRHLDIPGGRITMGPVVQMDFRGEADLVPDGGVKLTVDIVETQLASLFPSWGDKVSGSVGAENCVFQSSFGKGPERTFSGDFTVKGALLRNMGFLNKVVHFLQRKDISSVEFPALKGHFNWSPSGGLELTNLSAEKDSFLRLSGDVTVSGGGELRGKLKVAVTDMKLNEVVDKVAHPFRPAEEGWSAMEFYISGTGASVDDNIRIEGMNFAQPVAPGEAPKKPEAPKPEALKPQGPVPATNDDAKTERDFRDLLQQPK